MIISEIRKYCLSPTAWPMVYYLVFQNYLKLSEKINLQSGWQFFLCAYLNLAMCNVFFPLVYTVSILEETDEELLNRFIGLVSHVVGNSISALLIRTENSVNTAQ